MRFCSFWKRRGAIPHPTLRSSRRLLVERLEDRVVPSMPDGTLLVATCPSTFSYTDQSSFPTGPIALVYLNGYLYVANESDSSGTIHSLVRVNPSTGEQRLITDGSDGVGFSVPTGMVLGQGNNVYVADEPGNVAGSDPGKIWQV